MKYSIKLSALLIVTVAAALAASSCSALSGTLISFTESGVEIIPPSKPIVIEK